MAVRTVELKSTVSGGARPKTLANTTEEFQRVD
jgi:hypothetical protein